MMTLFVIVVDKEHLGIRNCLFLNLGTDRNRNKSFRFGMKLGTKFFVTDNSEVEAEQINVSIIAADFAEVLPF